MTSSILLISVILSGGCASRSEGQPQSKDPLHSCAASGCARRFYHIITLLPRPTEEFQRLKEALQVKIIHMPAKSQGHDTRYVKMQKNNCFVCGMNNPEGMRLKFILDEERQTFICRFRLGKRYTGPPGHCHGGIIACILDDAMGKVNKLHHVIALTREMTIDYLKPVPLHKPLRVEGREVKVLGRTHINAAEILNEKDEVLARSRGTFIAIDPAKMFGKFVER